MLALGQLPRGKLLPSLIIALRIVTLRIIPPRKLAPHDKISLENNCPHSRKFPLKSEHKKNTIFWKT